MGFFRNFVDGVRVMRPFNSIMDNPGPAELGYGAKCPIWWNDEHYGFLILVKLCLSHRNPLLALMFDNFSDKTIAAIANAAYVLDKKGYSQEKISDLIAVQIISYSGLHGANSLTRQCWED